LKRESENEESEKIIAMSTANKRAPPEDSTTYYVEFNIK